MSDTMHSKPRIQDRQANGFKWAYDEDGAHFFSKCLNERSQDRFALMRCLPEDMVNGNFEYFAERGLTNNNPSNFDKALSSWTPTAIKAALREGWCLSVCSGATLQLQCQKIDDPEMASQESGFDVPALKNDDAAMKVMLEGTQSHHVLAKKILQEYAPDEWQLIQKTVSEMGNSPNPDGCLQ